MGYSKEISIEEADFIRSLQKIHNKSTDMYLVTSRNKSGNEMIIWKYRYIHLARRDYLELKKKKYKDVHISQVFK